MSLARRLALFAAKQSPFNRSAELVTGGRATLDQNRVGGPISIKVLVRSALD
jgi:hypothetical protein